MRHLSATLEAGDGQALEGGIAALTIGTHVRNRYTIVRR